jgi:hypothetical protein
MTVSYVLAQLFYELAATSCYKLYSFLLAPPCYEPYCFLLAPPCYEPYCSVLTPSCYEPYGICKKDILLSFDRVRYSITCSSLSSRTWFKHRWIFKVVTILYVYSDKQQGKATKLKLAANIGFFHIWSSAKPTATPGRTEVVFFKKPQSRCGIFQTTA